MPVVYVTRRYRFCAGHRLVHPGRDPEWNRRVFGKCSTPGGHGHNYELEVTVRGVPHPETGRVVPRAELDTAVEHQVLEPLDHRNLNEVLEPRDGPAPTTEVLLLEIRRRLEGHLPAGATLYCLSLRETAKNRFELALSERDPAAGPQAARAPP